MSCSCNASALKLFARGLVQVHRLEPAMPFALPVRFTGALVSQRRSLHASGALRDAENPAPANPTPEKQPMSAETSQPTDSGTPTPTPTPPAAAVEPTNMTKSHEECTDEARGKAAWRFKQQGFDWKAFRSKDPAVRGKADFSNFDWKHWQGKKQGSKQLNQLVDNLEAARAEDRAAVGILPREGGASRFKDQRKLRTSTSAPRYTQTTAPDDGALPQRKKEEWMIQKEATKAKFPEGWKPHKRLSPDALAGIRALNAQFPDVYTTQTLADKFAVSPEAIRRILKSKWTPSSSEEEDRQQRWHRRGIDVWTRKAELGIKPPQRWRDEGIAREPEYHDRKAAARRGREEQVRREREEYMRSFTKGREAAAAADKGSDGPLATVTETETETGGRRRRDAGETRSTEEKPRWGTRPGRRDGPSHGRQTRRRPDQDVFDQTLASERRE